MKPDHCTSVKALLFGEACKDAGNYCLECHHALYRGQGKDRNGKLWLWQYNPEFGLGFLKANGDFLKRQPVGDDHPALELFRMWLKGIK